MERLAKSIATMDGPCMAVEVKQKSQSRARSRSLFAMNLRIAAIIRFYPTVSARLMELYADVGRRRLSTGFPPYADLLRRSGNTSWEAHSASRLSMKDLRSLSLGYTVLECIFYAPHSLKLLGCSSLQRSPGIFCFLTSSPQHHGRPTVITSKNCF